MAQVDKTTWNMENGAENDTVTCHMLQENSKNASMFAPFASFTMTLVITFCFN